MAIASIITQFNTLFKLTFQKKIIAWLPYLYYHGKKAYGVCGSWRNSFYGKKR
jgi:hypothetical protein